MEDKNKKKGFRLSKTKARILIVVGLCLLGLTYSYYKAGNSAITKELLTEVSDGVYIANGLKNDRDMIWLIVSESGTNLEMGIGIPSLEDQFVMGDVLSLNGSLKYDTEADLFSLTDYTIDSILNNSESNFDDLEQGIDFDDIGNLSPFVFRMVYDTRAKDYILEGVFLNIGFTGQLKLLSEDRGLEFSSLYDVDKVKLFTEFSGK